MLVRPPISDVTKLDVLGKRKDGGVDMGIVAESEVDDSAETLTLIDEKVRNYLREAHDSAFQADCEVAGVEGITIVFDSSFRVHPKARALLESLAEEVAAKGMRLLVVAP